MKQQNQIIVIAICIILAIIGITYQVQEARKPDRVSLMQEVKIFWQEK